MVPKIHPRGKSFKEACRYILHDPGQDTRERIAWTMTQELGDVEPDDAWRPMHKTWTRRKALKIANGIPTTGRDNTEPVFHYSLAWHKDDKPTHEQMKAAALETLKVLGLGGHQAVMAGHNDKDHMHVHIVVNTVHPATGKTAQLRFTKEKLSRWAEAYEREHGIHCEERITNNAERDRLKEERRRSAAERQRDPTDVLIGRHPDPSRQLMAAGDGPQKARSPYVPVKHRAPTRKQWFEKQEVVAQMRAMRKTLDAGLKIERSATSQRQAEQRDALDAATEAKVETARAQVRDRYRPRWRSLYRYQKREERHVARISGNLFERAAFVFENQERLGGSAKMTPKSMLQLILSPKRLQKRVADLHLRERREMAREEKTEKKQLTDGILDHHKRAMHLMQERHTAERQREKSDQALQRSSISFDLAKAALADARSNLPRPFVRDVDPRPERQPMPLPERAPPPLPPRGAPPPAVQEQFREAAPEPPPPPMASQFDRAAEPDPPLSRAEQIRRDMAEWRKRNEGKDFGREL
ncbi:MAG: relaxase/mobilization nuclease domain-containing protein [Hyphomicrobiaceae bacterium]